MKKCYLLLLAFMLAVTLVAQNTKQDTIMIGLSIPEVIFAEDKKENERLLSPSRIEKINAVDIFQNT